MGALSASVLAGFRRCPVSGHRNAVRDRRGAAIRPRGQPIRFVPAQCGQQSPRRVGSHSRRTEWPSAFGPAHTWRWRTSPVSAFGASVVASTLGRRRGRDLRHWPERARRTRSVVYAVCVRRHRDRGHRHRWLSNDPAKLEAMAPGRRCQSATQSICSGRRAGVCRATSFPPRRWRRRQPPRFGSECQFHVGGSSPGGGRVGPRDRRSESLPSVGLPTERYPASTTVSASAARLIGTAEQFIGVPYRFGGTSPRSGFDCSGFVQYVFAQQGVRLPRTASEQAQVGMSLSSDWRAVSPGDLVDAPVEENGRISHVAIYAGRNRIIHSSSSGGGVRYDDLSTQRGEWFVDHMVVARRVTPDPRGFSLDLARSFANGTEVQLDGPDHAPKPR